MTVLANVLDSFAASAHVFTGVGSDMGRLAQVMRSKHSKQAIKKTGPSPSLFGNRSEAYKTEDDRWSQVEGGSPIQWQSCPSCAFLYADDELKCEVCGTSSPKKSQGNHFSFSEAVANAETVTGQHDAQQMSLTEVVITGGDAYLNQPASAVEATVHKLVLQEVSVIVANS